MPNLKISRLVSPTPVDLWKVLTDFDHWPDIYPHVSRVKVLQGKPPDIELQCSDSQGRVWHEVCDVWEPHTQLRMNVRPDDNHPYRKLSRAWVIESRDGSTHLTLACEYAHRMPLVGKWFEKLVGRGNLASACESAMDNVVQRALEQKWTYRETVQTILNHKGASIIAARPDDTAARLCAIMSEHGIGTILIRGEDGELQGIVSERDVVRHLNTRGNAVLELPAEQIMTRKLIVCEPEHDLFFVMACMTENKVRHLPVMKDGVLLGIVSIGDVVQQRMKSLQAESATMREYIAAREWRYHNQHGPAAAEPVGVNVAD